METEALMTSSARAGMVNLYLFVIVPSTSYMRIYLQCVLQTSFSDCNMFR